MTRDDMRAWRGRRRTVRQVQQPEQAKKPGRGRRYRLSDLERNEVASQPVQEEAQHLVAARTEEFENQFDQLAERVLNTQLRPSSQVWTDILRRPPTADELIWLERWRMTAQGNRMLVGYLTNEEGIATSVRIIVWRSANRFLETYHGVNLHIPADSHVRDPDVGRPSFPNSGEAMLFIKREFERANLVFTVENPGKMANVLTQAFDKAASAVRKQELEERNEFSTKARGFDL